jgi:hypothetical protein
MYIYVCVCVYIYIYIHTHMHTYVYIHTYICMYIYTHTHRYTLYDSSISHYKQGNVVYTNTYMYICLYVLICAARHCRFMWREAFLAPRSNHLIDHTCLFTLPVNFCITCFTRFLYLHSYITYSSVTGPLRQDLSLNLNLPRSVLTYTIWVLHLMIHKCSNICHVSWYKYLWCIHTYLYTYMKRSFAHFIFSTKIWSKRSIFSKKKK